MQVRLSPRRRLGTFRLGETVAHNIPTGLLFMGQPGSGTTDFANQLSEIWNGEGGSYKACDRVIPYPGPADGAMTRMTRLLAATSRRSGRTHQTGTRATQSAKTRGAMPTHGRREIHLKVETGAPTVG